MRVEKPLEASLGLRERNPPAERLQRERRMKPHLHGPVLSAPGHAREDLGARAAGEQERRGVEANQPFAPSWNDRATRALP